MHLILSDLISIALQQAMLAKLPSKSCHTKINLTQAYYAMSLLMICHIIFVCENTPQLFFVLPLIT